MKKKIISCINYLSILKDRILNKIKPILKSQKAIELINGSFWSFLSALISKVLIFGSWILVARILGSNSYGQFGIIRSTVIMFTTFSGFSLGITASKHVAEFMGLDAKNRVGDILGLTIIFGIFMGLIIGIVFYLLAPWLATNTLNSPDMAGELRICAVILFFSALNGAQIGGLQGFGAFKSLAIINILLSLLSVPLFIFGALYFGVYGTIWAFAISFVINCILSHLLLKRICSHRNIQIRYKSFLNESKILYKYSLPAFLSGLLISPVKWFTDSLLVRNGGFEEMGVFSAIIIFNSIIMAGAGILSAPFISIMAKNKNDSINSKFSRLNILIPWFLGALLTSPFLVFPEVGLHFFGDSYKSNSFNLTFTYVILFTLIMMFKQGLSRIIIIYNLQWWSLISNIIWGLVLALSFYFFESKTALTLSICYLIAYIFNVLLIIPLYFKLNIIPLKTIETKESLFIWLTIILLVLAGNFLNNFYLRFFILFTSLIIISKLFLKIYNKSIYNKQRNES